MNLTLTMAIGDKKWGALALNLCLSIKAADPRAKTALIYTATAIEGVEEYIETYFDYTYRLQDSVITNPIELAFKTKTELYSIALQIEPDAEAYLFMDADTIMLSGRSVNEYFAELKDVDFTMWCNDVYDYATGKRMRDDYTFWCEPDEVFKGKWANNDKDWSPVSETMIGGNHKMPQVNSSFMYFKRSKKNWELFQLAQAVWADQTLPYKKYRDVKPDEFCFNVALCQANILPHQIPYYPIFFSFASEHFEEQYIRNWKAIGFAGDDKQHPDLITLYNNNVSYFRSEFDAPELVIDFVEDKKPKDRNQLSLTHSKRRTIFRQGEVANSDGGIFNPDAIITSDGHLMTIMRKEKNHDAYKNTYTYNTGIPFVYFDDNNNYELKFTSYPEGVRLEDFRLFSVGSDVWCNHKVVVKITQNINDLKSCLARIVGDEMVCVGIPELPVKMGRMDINWGFFSEDKKMYCLYSLNPYKLFVSDLTSDYKKWEYVEVERPELDWFHKGQFICNSTNPILVDDHYLVFFHTKKMAVYFHGACLINKTTKQIEYYTRNSFNIEPTQSGREKGLLYVSGSLYLHNQNSIRVFFGDCDSHAGFVEYDKDLLINEIKKYKV